MGRRKSLVSTNKPDRVLVLGATGMLGSMVTDYLHRTKQYEIWATVRKGEKKSLETTKHILEFDVSEDTKPLDSLLKKVKPKWIINCIGIIKPFCKDDNPQQIKTAILVNALFPYQLVDATKKNKTRIIQIATDCVYSGLKGSYDEQALHDPLDVYGKTKSLGEVRNAYMLNIRCSILGPEPKNKVSLFEWFLSQPDKTVVSGFTHHTWNGITTLQFSQCCEMILKKGPTFFDDLVKESSVHHFVPNQQVTKYQLLKILATVFEKRVKIKPVSKTGPAVNRSLATTFKSLTKEPQRKPMPEALQELHDYLKKYAI